MSPDRGECPDGFLLLSGRRPITGRVIGDWRTRRVSVASNVGASRGWRQIVELLRARATIGPTASCTLCLLPCCLIQV
jgi:hypothetical protein